MMSIQRILIFENYLTVVALDLLFYSTVYRQNVPLCVRLL